jgi:hypothetical protein
MSKFQAKTVLASFLDVKGIVMPQYTKPDETWIRIITMSFCRNCNNNKIEERDRNWGRMVGFLTRENAPAHNALSVSNFWPENKFLFSVTSFTHQASVRATFSSFLSWYIHRNEHVFNPLRTSRETAKGCFHALQESVRHSVSPQENYYNRPNYRVLK